MCLSTFTFHVYDLTASSGELRDGGVTSERAVMTV